MNQAEAKALSEQLKQRLNDWADEGAYEELQINGRRVKMNLYQLSNFLESIDQKAESRPRRRFYFKNCCS